MKIEEGKFYRTRDGRKVGPMLPDDSFDGEAFIAVKLDGDGWSPAGHYIGCNDGANDIVAEWTEEAK